MSENGQMFIPDGARNAALLQRNDKLRQDLRATEDNADFINAALISEQHKNMALVEENTRLRAVLDRHGIDPNEIIEAVTEASEAGEAGSEGASG